MPITKLRPTFTFDEDRLAALRAVVPEAFADGRINWETLRAALGEHLEDDEDAAAGGSTAEHFGLFWPGKRAARRLASAPSKGTLAPQPGLGVNEATTRNLFIEGDNLEVLKLLLKSYAGRVKLIYIDPPYNTGNDFVYPDDFTEPLEAYLRRTGQLDEEGQKLTTNTKTSGRFHSNWLTMMYPRLLLARQFLQENGMIFVSIDDNEVHHLRQVMNEVFGEENFIAEIVWQKMYSGKADASHFGIFHEYILCYGKAKDFATVNLLTRTESMNARYTNPDNDPRGPWLSNDLTAAGERSAGHYDVVSPTGKVFDAPQDKHWLYSQKRMGSLLSDNRIWFGKDGNSFPRLKRFLSEVQQGRRVNTLWLHEEVGHTDEATKEIKTIFDAEQRIFDTPKPVRLMTRLLQLATDKGEQSVVLDFYAGSCSMAHAILALNQKDGEDRRFIMVQLPEPTGNPAYPTIADIGRERIRRVIARMAQDDGRPTTDDGQLPLLEPGQPSAVNGQETTDDRRPTTDLGFKSYRLTRSHFKAWQAYTGEDPAALETLFTQFESPLVAGWEPEALLTEVLLLEGFPLDSHVRPLPAFTANRLVEVSADFCAHRLTVCLDARLHPDTLAALELRAEDTFVCLDSALTDETKITLADRCNLRVI